MGEDARSRWLLAGLGLLFLAGALAAPINHDESQYVAAIALMREGLPYRDWAYLQTPLQPLLLSPLSLLPAGWLLVGARLANVLFALATCWALLRLLKGRAPFWTAAAAVVGLATSSAFLFGSQVARNDMLPVALLMLALVLLLPREGGLAAKRAALAGLCLGLAISAKISLALPAAGAGLWLLMGWRRTGWQVVLAATLGGLAGLLPSLLLFAAAAEQFWFGVFTYSLVAPQAFWSAVGEVERLATLVKLGDLGEELLEGGAALGILLCVATARRRWPERHLLELTIAGGLLAALLPDPFFQQYAVPLLPPLFACAGLALPGLAGRWRQGVLLAASAFALLGAGSTLLAIARIPFHKPELVESVERGRIVAAAAGGGTVVTLAGEQVAGADVRLDPRFAAGPFLFRMHGEAGAEARRSTGVPTFSALHGMDRDPPGVIVTGGERRSRPPLFPEGPDAPLDEWARERGYAAVPLPGDGWRMWVAPTKKGGPEGPPSRVTLP